MGKTAKFNIVEIIKKRSECNENEINDWIKKRCKKEIEKYNLIMSISDCFIKFEKDHRPDDLRKECNFIKSIIISFDFFCLLVKNGDPCFFRVEKGKKIKNEMWGYIFDVPFWVIKDKNISQMFISSLFVDKSKKIFGNDPSYDELKKIEICEIF